MESHNEGKKSSHRRIGTKFTLCTGVARSLLCSLCFLSACINSQHLVAARALSDAEPVPDLPLSASEPKVFIAIPSWENRTAYPRFFVYRDQLRRRLENGDSNESSSLPNYSKVSHESGEKSDPRLPLPVANVQLKESTSHETDKNNEFSMEDERLLSEHRKKSEPVNANSSKNDTSNQEAHNANIPPAAAASDEHSINFPKDKTNPCNRLQLNPEEEEQDNRKSAATSAPASSEEIEIGNRENFPVSQKEPAKHEASQADLIRNAVPTFDLSLKVVAQSKWNEENAIFSPLSLANVLSMLLLGAGGNTWKDLSMQLDKYHYDENSTTQLSSMESVSQPSHDLSFYHAFFKKLLSYLKNHAGQGVVLNSASEIFVDRNFPIIKTFQEDLLNFYGAPVEPVDFGMEGVAFMERVNQWVREKTHNQIQTILEEPPPLTTTMGIINAIYFKGSWEHPFSPKLTRWRDFRVQPGEKLKREMMINILDIPYVERGTYKMTAVPYKGNKTALYLVLPKGNSGINDLKEVEKHLTKGSILESIGLMNITKVALTLPKLKYSADGEMMQILRNMGLSSIFQKANFSGISSEKGLYISRLLHRAVVEINEKGTEASAVSFGTADRIFSDPPVPFGCDKPFIFFIYHVDTDTVLFWGRVVRPEN